MYDDDDDDNNYNEHEQQFVSCIFFVVKNVVCFNFFVLGTKQQVSEFIINLCTIKLLLLFFYFPYVFSQRLNINKKIIQTARATDH